jgi:hypothetical protein
MYLSQLWVTDNLFLLAMLRSHLRSVDYRPCLTLTTLVCEKRLWRFRAVNENYNSKYVVSECIVSKNYI